MKEFLTSDELIGIIAFLCTVYLLNTLRIAIKRNRKEKREASRPYYQPPENIGSKHWYEEAGKDMSCSVNGATGMDVTYPNYAPTGHEGKHNEINH